jgi:predicted transcriptional regulator
MRDRRDKMKIIEDILKIAEDPMGAKKTHLVYGANLNFKRLQKYLNLLIEKELLERREDPEVRFYLSTKGREFLKQVKQIHELL